MYIAKNSNGELVSINQVPSITKDTYTCVACGKEVYARNKKPAEFRKRGICFSHYGECSENDETFLHNIAKELIKQHRRIMLPDIGEFICVEVYTETLLVPGITPDSLIRSEPGGQQIAIEVFVTNKKTREDIIKYDQHGITCYEIDLSKLSGDSELEEIRQMVIEATENKQKISPIILLQVIKQKSVWQELFSHWLTWLVAIAVLIAIFRKPGRTR